MYVKGVAGGGGGVEIKFVLIYHVFCSSTWRPLVGQISVQIIQYCPTKFMTERTKEGK